MWRFLRFGELQLTSPKINCFASQGSDSIGPVFIDSQKRIFAALLQLEGSKHSILLLVKRKPVSAWVLRMTIRRFAYFQILTGPIYNICMLQSDNLATEVLCSSKIFQEGSPLQSLKLELFYKDAYQLTQLLSGTVFSSIYYLQLQYDLTYLYCSNSDT